MEKIIIFITNNLIYGLTVDRDNKTFDYINVSGKNYMKYLGESDIDDFCGYICDNFFISDFSKINIKITIINCGANSKTKGYLYQKCSDAECLDILEIETALSFLMPLHSDIKAGKEYLIKHRDICYIYKDMNVLKAEMDKFDIEIKDDFFVLLFNLQDKNRISLSENNIQLVEEVANLKKKLNAKEIELEKLKKSTETKKAEIKTYEQMMFLHKSDTSSSSKDIYVTDIENKRTAFAVDKGFYDSAITVYDDKDYCGLNISAELSTKQRLCILFKKNTNAPSLLAKDKLPKKIKEWLSKYDL